MSIRRVMFGLVLSTVAMMADAAGPGPESFAGSAQLGPSTPSQRGVAARQFVLKWGAYVQQTYGVNVRTWALRMAPQFAKADSANLRMALGRETFEGAMAALDGVGHRVSDGRVIDTLARLPTAAPAERSRIVAKALGDTTQDLVYNPITPCRIVDTRNTAAGAIPANGTRNFLGAGISNYTNQGGSSTNCGMNTEAPTAIVLNVTAVTPVGAGYATVYPFGTTRPDTASVNYTAGAVVNNAITTAIPTPVASFDFIIYSFAQAHYVVDIVGYFDNPRSSPVSCVNAAATVLSISAGTSNTAVPATACPTGYGDVGVNCESSSWDMPLVFVSAAACGARNNGSTAANLSASRRCCRIPGR